MRIRSTKPEFWRSERIASVSWDARLVLKGLESYVDDNGVGRDDIALIVGDLFQRDLVREPSRTLARVSEAISDLCQAGLLWRYEVDGTQLIYLSFWEQIQRVDKAQAGRFPRPDGTMNYKDSVIRESVGNVRELSRGFAPGTGEQGNRGTGVESPSDSLAHRPARDTKRKADDYTPEFESWWLLYPRKVDKAPAFKAFLVARKRVSLEVLTETVRRYASEVAGKDAEHIKHGATWLSKRCWENYSPSQSAASGQAAREWLRGEHAAGRVKPIQEKTGLVYREPDLPLEVSGKEAVEAFYLEAVRKWIVDNSEEIMRRLTLREAG